MTTIFISCAKEDNACADAIQRELETKGYTIQREPTAPSMESILYPRTHQDMILGSALVLLLWSGSAAQSQWVERDILFAQQLKKPIVPIALDGTELLPTLVAVTPIPSRAPCSDVLAQLAPWIPAPGSQDALLTLYEQAAHSFILRRKEAIDRAAEMLRRDEHRDAVLAVLEYLARHDLMMGVRDKAQEALAADAQHDAPPLLPPAQSRHMFGVRCRNGHVTYFNKQRVCAEKASFAHRRVERAGKELDELKLSCQTCGEVMMVRIDCEAY